MKKILAILRESTTKQEIESQKKQLTEFLLTKGFQPDEIEYIEAQGASARKANQKYKDFLAAIKRTLEENETIKTVGLWHLNRLGRIKKYLTDMEHYFVSNGVQMYVKNGFDMPLLAPNAEGKMVETIGASIAFSVYSAMVELETSEMFEKTKRGKERNKEEGKYNGGKLPLGYKVNTNGYFEIDEQGAEIVRNMFHLYVNENWSAISIYKHYSELGVIKKSLRLQTGYRTLTRILGNDGYIGKKLYPQIIDNELFDKAKQKLSNNTKPHNSGNIFYCKGLLKDTLTNTLFAPRFATLTYQVRFTTHCYYLNINCLDYACWFVASLLKRIAVRNENKTNKEEYKVKIEENILKIQSKKENISNLEQQIEKAIGNNIRYPKHYTTEKMEKDIESFEKDIEKLNNEIFNLTAENTRMEQFIEGKVQKDKLYRFNGEYTDEMKKEIIDSVIDRIEVTKNEEGKFIIKFFNKIGYIDNSYFEYWNNNNKIFFHMIDANGAKIDFSKSPKRFERRRYEKKS